MVKKISFKYFTGYDDNNDIRPLQVRFPQMTGYTKCFENDNKTLSLKVTDKKTILIYGKKIAVFMKKNLIVRMNLVIMISI